jgi:hypothetical protein
MVTQRFDDGSEAPTELCQQAQSVVRSALRHKRLGDLACGDGGELQPARHDSLAYEQRRLVTRGVLVVLAANSIPTPPPRPTLRARLRRGWHRLLSLIFYA